MTAISGPFPWKIETSDLSDFEILNRDYTDGVKTYYHTGASGANMGSVGVNTQKVTRIGKLHLHSFHFTLK